MDWGAFTALETVGIDEVALRQGHGQSVVAVIWAQDAQGRTHVLTILPDRLQTTVQAFLETIPQALKATVQRVCIDRWEGYAGAVAAALPKALIVVNRFHIAVHSRDAMADRRQPECRRLNAGRPADQTLPTADLRRLLRREWPSLTPAQQRQLLDLFKQTPILVSASRLRITLTAIFECTPARVPAQTRLRRWGEQVKAAGLTCFDKFLHPLHYWQEGILNYFEGRHPGGFVEGPNNKLKLLKRRCFGLDDPVELFRRLWLDIEGPRLWA